MPKAVRKSVSFPDWQGGTQTGPTIQEMRDAGIVAFEIAPLKSALQLWAKHLNMISGGMVLAFGKKGVKRAFLKQSVDTLRQVADEMEKFL